MGQEAIYKCNNCGNEFKSHEGGGFLFKEYRCVNCDTIKRIETRSELDEPLHIPTKDELGACKRCGGELRDDIKPMCHKCKSRDVKEKNVLVLYD